MTRIIFLLPHISAHRRKFICIATLLLVSLGVFYPQKRKNAVTIVTAFINIGDHRKGDNDTRTVDQYVRWMRNWQKVKNAVIFYTNDKDNMMNFKKIREINRFETKTVFLDIENSKKLWSMDLLPNISTIFKQPGYPKHYPNTALPMYSTIMNLKYDLLEDAILSNSFQSDYFAWIDIGFYRYDHPDVPCFRVGMPPSYDERKVAMNQITTFVPGRKAKNIVKRNEVWVGGHIFGHKEPLLGFIRQYRETAKRMIQRGWYSTDQQTVFSMFSDRTLGVNLDVDVQVYVDNGARIPHYKGHIWFYLGYLMRNDEAC